VAGHRGDIVAALAGRALAAMEGAATVEPHHIARVAPLALAHRKPGSDTAPGGWSEDDRALLDKLVAAARAS
jgi:magnesium chelatase subunit I